MGFRPFPVPAPPKGTFASKPALHSKELELFLALQKSICLLSQNSRQFSRLKNAVILPKVVLSEFIQFDEKDKNRLWNKSIDFLICDSNSLKPLVAVELDGDEHHKPRTKAHDTVKDFILNTAGIPVKRFPPYPEFMPDKIARHLDNARVPDEIEWNPWWRDQIPKKAIPNVDVERDMEENAKVKHPSGFWTCAGCLLILAAIALSPYIIQMGSAIIKFFASFFGE